jgi:hypothetical protein
LLLKHGEVQAFSTQAASRFWPSQEASRFLPSQQLASRRGSSSLNVLPFGSRSLKREAKKKSAQVGAQPDTGQERKQVLARNRKK